MIDIVLATYNGEQFLEEQVQSIQACTDYHQLVSHFIIVDDGSTDNTICLIQRLAKQDQRIELHINDSGLHGPSHNFAYGLTKTSANYIMLSDQDDVWLPEKLILSLQQIQELEADSTTLPALVFSDKVIVDEQLNVLCDSYFELKNISKTWHLHFNQLCQQNVVSGCTTLINRALLDKALPIPEQAYMHDWWLALVASRCGKIAFIEKPLIQYRQHDNNVIGAKKKQLMMLFLYLPSYYKAFKESYQATINQAVAFQQFEKKQNLESHPAIKAMVTLENASIYKKISHFYNRNVTRSHLLGRLALLFCLLTTRAENKNQQD